MATRLQGGFYSLRENTHYEVFIDDRAPSTGTITSICVKDCSIRHEAAEKDIDAHLLLSKLKVSFIVENSTQRAVFTDMAGSEETRFKVRVHKDGNLHYVGFVLLDLFTEDDVSGSAPLVIEATDGIGRLKSIDYDGGGVYYDDYTTFLDHFKSILAAVPLTDYYAATEEYLRINVTLWPDGLTPDGTTDHLALIRCSYRAFRSIDRQGSVKFSSYYDVLFELCRALGVRFMYSNGRYVISDTIDYTRTTGAVRFIRYDIAGTQLSTETLGQQWTPYTYESGEGSEYLDTSKDAVTRAGGKITHLPALQAVNWSYQHYSRQNVLSTIAEWSNVSSANVPMQNFRTAPSLQLRVNANAQVKVTPPTGEQFPSTPVYAIIGMKLFIERENGSIESVVRQEIVTTAGVAYDTPEWLGGEDGRYFAFSTRVESPFLGNPTFVLSATTPDVPSDGTLNLRFYLVGVYKNGQIYSGATTEWRVFDPYLETYIEGSVTAQYNFSNFSATNTAFTGNSVSLDRPARLGDGPNNNSFGRVEYYDGSEWLITSGWRKYAGASYQDASSALHGSRRATDVLALQEQPRQKLQGTISVRSYSADFIYLRATKRYLPYKAKHDLSEDTVTGEWIEIAYQPAAITDPTEAPSDDNPIGGESGGIVPDTSGPLSTGGPLTSEDGQIPPGLLAPTLTTISSGIDGEVPESVPADTIPVTDTPADLPLFDGDILVITHPTTGQQHTVTVTYNSELGVPAKAQDGSTAGSFPYYTSNGIVWLVSDDSNVAVEGFTPSSTIPENSFLQFNAAYLARLRALLRIDHVDANITAYDTSLTNGFADWFWRPSRRIGWHIRKVHFAFAQAGTGTAKVNLKYYDATGFRYTVATHNETAGLGTVQDAFAIVAEGYYRVEVETITGAAPKGLTVIIELIKILS